uniref:Putative conserved plasma membrane protein n=1 Tax=Amblyomma aureolatum TaxID=187763 RepID=A0A1E1X9J3_9ACAR
MPRVDFLPSYDNSGSYTRIYRGSVLFLKYTWLELLLLFCNVINVVVQLGMGIPLLIQSAQEALAVPINVTANNPMPLAQPYDPFAFDVIVLFTVAFGAWFGVSGVLLEHEYEIALHMACMMFASVYSATEYYVCGDSFNSSLILYRALVVATMTSISAVLAIKAIFHPAWTEFVLVGVSEGMIEMYKTFCKFLALLKLEFLLYTIFGILVLNAGVHSTSWQFTTMSIIIVYSLVLWYIGSLAVRKERQLLVYTYVALSMIAPLFLPLEISARFPNKTVQIADAPIVHLVAGAFCVLMRVYLHIELLRVFKNFNCGLVNQAFLGLLTPETTGLLSGRRH